MPPKKPKAKYDWLQFEVEFMQSDPSRIPDLPAFFAPYGISPNTFKNQTVGWPEKRRLLREKIARDAIKSYQKRASDFIARTMTYAEVAQGLAFREMVGKATEDNPAEGIQKGDPILKGARQFTKAELIRLFTEASRVSGAVLEVQKILSKDQEKDAQAFEAIPQLAGAPIENEEATTDNQKKIQRILQSDEAIEAAETILKAIDEGGSNEA